MREVTAQELFETAMALRVASVGLDKVGRASALRASARYWEAGRGKRGEVIETPSPPLTHARAGGGTACSETN